MPDPYRHRTSGSLSTSPNSSPQASAEHEENMGELHGELRSIESFVADLKREHEALLAKVNRALPKLFKAAGVEHDKDCFDLEGHVDEVCAGFEHYQAQDRERIVELERQLNKACDLSNAGKSCLLDGDHG
jgi:hypothetical protein